MSHRKRAALRACRLGIIGVASLLGGCASGFLPGSGPFYHAFFHHATAVAGSQAPRDRVHYALVAVNAPVIGVLQADDVNPIFSDTMGSAEPARPLIGVGDVLAITIFESGAGGLFVPQEAGARPGNYVQLPNQQVDDAGFIAVPFSGKLHVAGLTVLQIQDLIQRHLADRALEPQVVVTIAEHKSNVVSVLGDVMTSARYSLDPGGDRVLAAIARAGGPKFPSYESFVTIQRGSKTEQALLSSIATQPQQNIQLQGGDTVYVSHKQRFFLALGATGQGQSLGPINRRFPFEDTNLSLADALAKAGGLEDDRANPEAVFVYRQEPRAQLARIVDAQTLATLADPVPTIYTFNLMQPDGLFYAARFPMHTEDTLYVSNAPSTDIAKFENLVLPLAYSTSSFRAGVQ